MEKVNKRIKEKFKRKSIFCIENGHKPKDFASKLKTAKNKLKWLNKFVNPLELKFVLVETEEQNELKRKEN